ncbi:hypothetical protein F5888DRAFT_1128112 [Russula emetica]|nr:hypothetical protein F5888DRAFT_1128112 [Russula emetica]
MQRHKIVARIILIILSVINFALAAPLVRGIREVRVDVVDVAEIVTAASRKRWNPSDKWWTNAADRTNTPSSLGSSDSDYQLEQELRPHDPRSPIDLNPRAPAPPEHNNLQDYDIVNDPDSPQASQESTDGSDSDSHSTGSEWSSDATMSPWAWYENWVISKSPSSSPSHDSNPPPRHGNSDTFLNRLQSSPGPTDDQPPSYPPSDPRPLKRPYDPSESEPGPSKRPYAPSEPGPSTWAYPPSDLGPSTGPYPPSDPRPSTSDPGSSTRPYPPSDPRPSTSDPGPSADSAPHPPSSPGPLQHESEFSELFRGRFKRGSVNAGYP